MCTAQWRQDLVFELEINYLDDLRRTFCIISMKPESLNWKRSRTKVNVKQQKIFQIIFELNREVTDKGHDVRELHRPRVVTSNTLELLLAILR